MDQFRSTSDNAVMLILVHGPDVVVSTSLEVSLKEVHNVIHLRYDRLMNMTAIDI